MEEHRGSTGGAKGSIEGAGGAERAIREYERAEGEHINETGVSGGAKRRHLSQQAVTCWLRFGEIIYIYIYVSL